MMSVANYTAGNNNSSNCIIIVKSIGINAEVFVSNSKLRKFTLENSLFLSAIAEKTTLSKGYFVITVTNSKKVKDWWNITELLNWQVNYFQQFNVRVESRVLAGVESQLDLEDIKEVLY